MKLALTAVTLLSTLWFAPSISAFQEPVDFTDPTLDAVITLMESEMLKEEVGFHGGSELASGLRKLLARQLTGEEGSALRGQTLAKLQSGTATERRKAMLLLTACDDLTKEDLADLVSSTDAEVLAWAYFHPLVSDALTAPSADQTLYTTGLREGDDPLKACSKQIGERLRRTDEQLVGLKEEFLEAYDNVFLPNLEILDTFARPNQRYWLDLDGDGVDEFFVRFRIPVASLGRTARFLRPEESIPQSYEDADQDR